MLRTSHKLTLLLLSTFLYAQFAEAVLLRSTGRGDKSNNFSQDFYYVENQYLNEIGIIDSAFDFDGPFANKSLYNRVGGGGRGLGVVPNTCVVGYTQDQVDSIETDRLSAVDFFNNGPNIGNLSDAEYDAAIAAINNDFDAQVRALTVGEPCIWEFTQNDPMSMFGFFGVYFDTADITYDVKWYIDGQVLPGDINTAGDLDTPDGTINKGWITLNTPDTLGLNVGDYSIYATVGLSSSTGKFFWVNRDSRNPSGFARKCSYEDNPNYDDTIPEGPDNLFTIETCGYNSFKDSDPDSQVSYAQTSFTSDFETLRILAASTDPDSTPVNAPASLGTFLLGLGALLLRRRSTVKKTKL
jgi:MYXO-CTERM domain-containing protein